MEQIQIINGIPIYLGAAVDFESGALRAQSSTLSVTT